MENMEESRTLAKDLARLQALNEARAKEEAGLAMAAEEEAEDEDIEADNDAAAEEENAFENDTEAALQQENDSFGVADKERKGPRIGFLQGFLMFLVALTFDCLQAIFDLLVIGIVINTIIDLWAWMTFYIWFKRRGISFGMSAKNAFKSGGAGMLKNPLAIIFLGLIIEAIPVINALPAWSLAIVISLGLEYATWLASKTLVMKAVGKISRPVAALQAKNYSS